MAPVPWFASLPGTEAHFLLEALGYFVGARLYWRAARGLPRPASLLDRWLLLGCAVFGAMLGSKLLHVAEHLPHLLAQNEWTLWLAGKSVLGGFIGGHIGVELGKRAIGWRPSTGDAWVLALTAGLCIGRLGCQLSGPWDQTYGIPTSLPWAWDYGDHLGRHPTALYEVLLVLGLSWACLRPCVRAKAGAGFAMFFLGYCLIRFGLEFLKPPYGLGIEGTLPTMRYAGLTAIQWAAGTGALAYALLLRRRLFRAASPSLT